MINILLWACGAALLVLAAWRIRAPYARMAELDRLAQNADRYATWRGVARTAASSNETTGADVMRQLLRRQVYLWAGVAVVGIVLLVAGFVVRS